MSSSRRLICEEQDEEDESSNNNKNSNHVPSDVIDSEGHQSILLGNDDIKLNSNF